MEEELISSNKYRVSIIYDLDIDYYMQCSIILQVNSNRYILAKDNVLFFRNLFAQYIQEKEKYELDERISELNIAKLYSKYNKYLFDRKVKNDLIMENGKWIGEKYICFSTDKYLTWFYRKDGKLYLKVTKNIKYLFLNLFNKDIILTSLNDKDIMEIVEIMNRLCNDAGI